MVEEEAPVVAAIVVPPLLVPEPRPIGLKNGLAVRIALSSCALSFLLAVVSSQIGIPPALSFLWFVGAGFFAVFLYKRRTGQHLSAMSGARLGWISGLFTFALVTIFLVVVAMALSDPSGLATLREQWKAAQRPEQELNQMIEIFKSPTAIVAGLIFSFVFFTSLPAFGGAICAKFFDRD
jgi:hypothetical protein